MNLDQLRENYEHHAGQARAYLAAWETADPGDGDHEYLIAAAQAHAQLAHGLAVLMVGAELSLSR